MHQLVKSLLCMAQNILHYHISRLITYRHPEYQYVYINDIVRAISNGASLRKQLNAAISQCADVHHLLQEIDKCRALAKQARSDQEIDVHTVEATRLVQRYISLLPFTSYCAGEKLIRLFLY